MSELDIFFFFSYTSELKKLCSSTVVDVVRTDSHLEFYEDTRNLARMSDILAVYAWVDPATGYCQGCGLFCVVYMIIVFVRANLCLLVSNVILSME